MKKLPRSQRNRLQVYQDIHDIERRLLVDKYSINDIIHLKRFAKEGYPLAMINLAMCYISGIGVSQDDETAIELLYLARESASGYEYYLIGIYLMHYSAIPHYYHEALSCLHKSVELGFTDALNVLEMYSS